jgi:hypothetical protein
MFAWNVFILTKQTITSVDCYVKASSSSKPHCYYVDSDCRIVYVQCFYKEVLVMLFLVDIPFIFLFTIDIYFYVKTKTIVYYHLRQCLRETCLSSQNKQ